MKNLLLTFVILIISCGKTGRITIEPQQINEIPPTHYKEPNKLVVDIPTISGEVEILNTANPANFIKDFSLVKHNKNNKYFQKGNVLYKLGYIENIGIKIENGKILNDITSAKPFNVSFSAFKFEKVNLQTGKVIFSTIVDNHFNSKSFLPTLDGEYWSVSHVHFNNARPVFLYNKERVLINCPPPKKICTERTDNYALASMDLNNGKMEFIKEPNGKPQRVYYHNESIYFTANKNKVLEINKYNLNDKSQVMQSIPLHLKGYGETLSRYLFFKDNLYISGRWSNNQMEMNLELFKFDLDLKERPEIAFDNETSGPDGNIDVISKGRFVTTIDKMSSLNNDILIITKEYNLKNGQEFKDLFLINSLTGEPTSYFNSGKPLARKRNSKEVIFNDENHIYFLTSQSDGIILEALNKGGVVSTINGGTSIKLRFNKAFTNPRIRFFEVHNGIATVVFTDLEKDYVKTFNLH